jgi:hypothetical protein
MRKVVAVSVFLVVAMLALDAQAEVTDKEPSLLQVWLWGLVGGGLGIAGWRCRWWLGVVAACLVLPFFAELCQELHDPFVGPNIRAEAGLAYVHGAYAATLVFFALHAAGAGLWLRRWSAGRRLTGR